MSAYSSIAALLASVFLLIAGNGLISTLVPLRATLDGFPPLAIGIMGSVYFSGMLAGTLAAPLVLRRAGHIRAFCAFVSLALIATLVLPMAVAPLPWIFLRGIIGFAFAGLYSVIDGWVSAKSKNENRGRVYGFYQIVNFSGSAMGQQMLTLADPHSFILFSVIAGLFALAVLPLAFTRAEEPPVPDTVRLRMPWLARMAPVGAMAAFIVGAANGTFWSLAPVYGLGIGMNPASLAIFLTAVVVGSAMAVWPIGRLSDIYDRRKIVVACAGLGALVEFGLWNGSALSAPLLTLLGFSLGCCTFVLYTLAVAHANDRTGASQAVIVGAGLLFLYCLGAIIAPPVGSALMGRFGPSSLFGLNGGLHLFLAIFALWRILLREKAAPVPREERVGEGGSGLP